MTYLIRIVSKWRLFSQAMPLHFLSLASYNSFLMNESDRDTQNSPSKLVETLWITIPLHRASLQRYGRKFYRIGPEISP